MSLGSIGATLSGFLAQNLPESFVKDRFIDVDEINKLPIETAGIADDGVPFIRLLGGPTFFGHGPNRMQRILYRLFTTAPFRKRIPVEAYNVAWDIVLRYWRDGHINQQRCYKLKAGDIVIEAGAYVGYYTIKMANLVGPEGRIIAIEPVDENREIIVRNLAANHINNVTVLPYAIWNKKGTSEFHLTDRQKNSLLADLLGDRGPIHSRSVPTNTIDNIVAELGIDYPELVIITINGAEIEALEGMSHLLDQHKSHLVVAAKYKRGEEPIYRSVVALLEENGYQLTLDHYGFVKNEDPEQQAVIYANPG